MEKDELDKLSKKELKLKCETFIDEIVTLRQKISDLENDNWYLECDVSNLEMKNEELEELCRCTENYIDMNNFKYKLELYNLDTVELMNFIDLYLKLYNN